MSFSRFVEPEISIKDFIANEANKNTLAKTRQDVKLVKDYLKQKGESRDIENIPPVELNQLLSLFIMSVRKKDGTQYEPASLRAFISSLDRYLKSNYYPTTLSNGLEFSVLRETLRSKQKELKRAGRGNRPNAAEPLNDEQINALWENKQFGCDNPESLINTLWFFTTVGFGLRGYDEHRQMCFGDIMVLRDNEGTEYLQFNERSTKTRQGDNPKDIRKVSPKIWATGSERCPVKCFQIYASKRPVDFCRREDPFYIATNNSTYFNKDKDMWYKRQPIGVNKLKSIMKRMACTLDTKLSNHSARKFLVQKLVDADLPPTEIIQISGHRNLQSINNYSHLSDAKHKCISSILTSKNQEDEDTEIQQQIRKRPANNLKNDRETVQVQDEPQNKKNRITAVETPNPKTSIVTDTNELNEPDDQPNFALLQNNEEWSYLLPSGDTANNPENVINTLLRGNTLFNPVFNITINHIHNNQN